MVGPGLTFQANSNDGLPIFKSIIQQAKDDLIKGLYVNIGVQRFRRKTQSHRDVLMFSECFKVLRNLPDDLRDICPNIVQ